MEKEPQEDPLFNNAEDLGIQKSGSTASANPDKDIKEKSRLHEWVSLHHVRLFAIYFCAGIGAVIALVYALHLILPESWRWLTPENLSELKGFSLSIISGVAVSIAISFVKKE